MGVYISPFPQAHPLPNLLAPHALPVSLTVVPTASPLAPPRPYLVGDPRPLPAPHVSAGEDTRPSPVSLSPYPTPPLAARGLSYPCGLVCLAVPAAVCLRVVTAFALWPVCAGFLGVAGARMEAVGARRSPGSRRRGVVSLRC